MSKPGRPNVRQSFGRKRKFMRWTLASVLAVVGGGTALASPASFSFTAPNEGWVPVLRGGQPVTDPEDDAAGARDIVGDQDNPMLYVAADATHLYFRLRVDSYPLQKGGHFSPFGWGCFMNTDSDPTTYELSTIIDGVSNPDHITFFKNTTTVLPNSPMDEPDSPPVSVVSSPLDATVGHARVVDATSMFGGDTDYFIDWAIERAVMEGAGFDTSAPTSYYCGSSNNGSIIASDCSGGADDECPLESQFSDPVSCGVEGCGVCGDGEVDGSEGCDDGGFLDGDGCNASCLLELGEPCSASQACASGFCDPDSDSCECDSDADCELGELCSTNLTPNACVEPGCGNAIVESGEGCDDGNAATGDGCDAACLRELGEDCTLAGQCASGFCDPSDGTCACDAAEDCPAAELCNTSADPNACVEAGCGNGVLETGEACDDGNTSPGDGCDGQCLLELGQPCDEPEDCQSEFCSNSDLCACDDNDDCADGRDCSGNVCVSPACGDGSTDTGEGCDDGGTEDGDGCSALCLLELEEPCTDSVECASSFCDPDSDTCACDQSVDCPSGQLCETGSAPNQCVDAGCGNSVLETGEGCDDGNTEDGDGCSAACLLELGEPCTHPGDCESGLCDPANSTCACDDASDCAGGQICDLGTAPNSCVEPGCGNGVLEQGSEGCDDGNLVDGDGCNAECLLELGQPCLDGLECASAACSGEPRVCVCYLDSDCPEGELCNNDVQPAACQVAGCGNGVLEAGEGCDDANVQDLDGCNAECLLELGEPCIGNAACASGLCDADSDVCTCADDDDCALGQTCDTAPDPNVCVAPGCGNGMLDTGESCDDGNTQAGDGCDETCRLELGEECDEPADCASGSCDGVDGTCECNQENDCDEGEVCNQMPSPNECVEPGCGDGQLDQSEACDDGNTVAGDGCNAECLIEVGEDCDSDDVCASGLCDPMDGSCACDEDADCEEGELCDDERDPNQCVSMECGNGVVDAGEACDDGNLADGDGCDAACLVELGGDCDSDDECSSGLCESMGSVCACDDDNDCDSDERCDEQREPNQCVGANCGNGIIDAGEDCDDDNLDDGDGCSITCEVEPGFECDEEPSQCEETGCQVDGDCGDRQTCDAGECVAVECTRDAHCGANETCDVERHVCGECFSDADCGPDFACDAEARECRDRIFASGGGVDCSVRGAGASASAPAAPAFMLLVIGLGGGLVRRRRRARS